MSAPAVRPAPTPDSDGQRDRALVLDWICSEHLQGDAFDRKTHAAWLLTDDEFQAASDALAADGLIRWRLTDAGDFSIPTEKGLAAHTAAQRALDAVAAGLDAQTAA